MLPLDSAQISSVEPERKSQELLNEWLKSYFNGNTQTISGETLDFPDLPIFFNQTALPITLEGPIIHWLFSDFRNRERMESDTIKLVTVEFIFTIYVRASASAVGNQAEFDVRRIADLLRFIILSPERQRLSQAGIHHIRCPRGPVSVDVPGWQSRLLVVTGQLQYRVDWK